MTRNKEPQVTDAAAIAEGLAPPIIHDLKTWPVYWDAINSGAKTFEVRKDDRGFQKGDILHLKRWALNNWHEQKFNCPVIEATITYVLTGGQFGIEPGYVVLGLAVRKILQERAE